MESKTSADFQYAVFVHVIVLWVCLCLWKQLSLFIEPGKVRGQHRQIGRMVREGWTDGGADSPGWGREMIKILMRIPVGEILEGEVSKL